MKKSDQKISRSMVWFDSLTEEQKSKAFEELIKYALHSEYIDIFSDDAVKELTKESGRPISYYEAPYFTTCGEPLIDTSIQQKIT